jgi:hypothetical protein
MYRSGGRRRRERLKRRRGGKRRRRKQKRTLSKLRDLRVQRGVRQELEEEVRSDGGSDVRPPSMKDRRPLQQNPSSFEISPQVQRDKEEKRRRLHLRPVSGRQLLRDVEPTLIRLFLPHDLPLITSTTPSSIFSCLSSLGFEPLTTRRRSLKPQNLQDYPRK